MKRAALFLLFLQLSVSCSQVRLPLFGKKEDPTRVQGWREYDADDYVAQLASFEATFLDSYRESALPLTNRATQYLENLGTSILQNNELFFSEKGKPRVHVIRDTKPFHFSLPGRVVFMSTGLINKYVKHEAVLAAILSFELVRSERKLYTKALVVPVGYMPLERLLGLSRVDSEDKIEIHKWAYYAMRRSGFDGEYYLSWLQTMNRNTADFITQVGDAASISREEAMFKSFLVRRAKLEDERTFARRESSKEFYQFLFYVKDKSA